MKISYLIGGLALTALACGTALAQAPAPAPGTAPQGQPEIKQVEDWTVRCYPMQSASPCDMFQQQNDAQSQQRILALSIAYIPHLDRHAIQISVPLGVSIEPGATIHAGTFSAPTLPYRRCDRGGCYVEMLIDNSVVDQLGRATEGALVKIKADDGKSYDLKVSLKGFTAAHDEMSALAKQKAKAPPPTPPAAPAK